MKKNKLLAAAALMMFISCNSIEDFLTPGAIPIEKLSIFGKTELLTGDIESLRIGTEPYYASNREILWGSDKPETASISAEGVLTALKPGEVTISAVSKTWKTAAAHMVTICAPTYESISITQVARIPLKEGTVRTLSIRYSPAELPNPKILWTSSRPEICMINDLGTVSGMKPGTATVTVTSDDGGFTDSVEITVESADPPGGS